MPNANRLGGREASELLSSAALVKIDARLQPGQSKVVARVGSIAVTAGCRDDAGTRYTELLASTTKANAFIEGDDSLGGGAAAADFLQPGTPRAPRLAHRADRLAPHWRGPIGARC